MLERLPSGIDGFDEICGGGLIKNGTYLVSGVAGSGKTIFGLQYLYRGAVDHGDSGIFLTTDQKPELIKKDALVFGWDFSSLEREGKILFVDATSVETGSPDHRYVAIRRFDMEKVVDQLIAAQEEISATRAVVDSTTSIASALQDDATIRLELLRLSGALKMLGLTSLIIYEAKDDKTHPGGVETFIADGVIILYFRRILDTRIHSIEVFKMRGSSHSTKIHPFDITSSGIVVNPSEGVFGEF
jgi:KaiC/GvpD/RAD55 family RecA-like ATPase